MKIERRTSSIIFCLFVSFSVFYRIPIFNNIIQNIIIFFLISSSITMNLFSRKFFNFYKTKIHPLSFLFFLYAFLAYQLFTCIWSVGASFSTIKVTVCLLFLFSVRENNQEYELQLSTYILMMIMLIIVYYIFGDYYYGGIRYSIVISGVSLEAGVYFGMSLFVLANALDLLLLSEPKRNLSKKLFSFVVILIIMYSIFLSGTRGILLSALAVLVSQIYSKRFSIKMILITTLVVILVFLIYSNYLSIELQERFTVEKMISSRASSRFDIWLRALNFLSERGIFRNIFGDGLYSTKYILGHTTDNTVIDVIIEFGLIGLVFFISMHISLLIEEIKTSNTVAISTHMGIIIWQLSVPLNLELVYWVLIFLIYSSNISRREMVKYSPKKSKKLINWQ